MGEVSGQGRVLRSPDETADPIQIQMREEFDEVLTLNAWLGEPLTERDVTSDPDNGAGIE